MTKVGRVDKPQPYRMEVLLERGVDYPFSDLTTFRARASLDHDIESGSILNLKKDRTSRTS